MSDETHTMLTDQVGRLEDASATPEAKQEACRALIGAATAAIPILIDRLAASDDPVFLEDMLVPTGPLNPGPPIATSVTVKFQIESLLYSIVYPDEPPPKLDAEPLPEADGPLAKMQAVWAKERDAYLSTDQIARPPLAFIEDWPAWWNAHKNESIDDMRRWARDEVDRRWDAISDQMTPPPSATR